LKGKLNKNLRISIQKNCQKINFQNQTHSPNTLKILPTFLPTLSDKNGVTLPEST
tara:strand:- start:986 stop:1150 length:165 start_codon:yes stop_codon:yes gene_type:complete